MAKRKPITVDLGDEIERPIRFSGAYSEALQIKHGSWAEFLKSDKSETIIAQLIFDGLVDKAEFTPESIKKSMDASLQLENLSRLTFALTGVESGFVNSRISGDAKNDPSQPLQ